MILIAFFLSIIFVGFWNLVQTYVVVIKFYLTHQDLYNSEPYCSTVTTVLYISKLFYFFSTSLMVF